MGNTTRLPVYWWPPIAIVGVVLICAVLARVSVPPTSGATSSNKVALQLLEGARLKADTAKQAVVPKQQYEAAVDGLAQLDAALHLVPQPALEAAARISVSDLHTKLAGLRDGAVAAL